MPLNECQWESARPQLAPVTTTSVTHHQEFPQVDTTAMAVLCCPITTFPVGLYSKQKFYSCLGESGVCVPLRQICCDYCTELPLQQYSLIQLTDSKSSSTPRSKTFQNGTDIFCMERDNNGPLSQLHLPNSTVRLFFPMY